MDIGVYGMATDSLKQVGKTLEHSRQQTKHSTRRVAYNMSIVEKSLDRVGTLYTFRMDFVTYTDSPSVYLEVRFFPKYKSMQYIGAGVG